MIMLYISFQINSCKPHKIMPFNKFTHLNNIVF